jgi:hypothetical protein
MDADYIVSHLAAVHQIHVKPFTDRGDKTGVYTDPAAKREMVVMTREMMKADLIKFAPDDQLFTTMEKGQCLHDAYTPLELKKKLRKQCS